MIYFYSYEVEFSKPKEIKPIPEGTVKVFFYIIEVEGGDNEIVFNFENESLKHRPGNTMRDMMYEVSRNQFMHLTTSFYPNSRGLTMYLRRSLRLKQSFILVRNSSTPGS